jgi:hypothetical protein
MSNPNRDPETFCGICGEGILYGYRVDCPDCVAAAHPETPDESLARLEQDLSTPDRPEDEFFSGVDRYDGYDFGDRPENFEAEQDAPEEGRSPLGTIQPEHEENLPF